MCECVSLCVCFTCCYLSQLFSVPGDSLPRPDPHINEVMVEVPSAERCFKY